MGSARLPSGVLKSPLRCSNLRRTLIRNCGEWQAQNSRIQDTPEATSHQSAGGTTKSQLIDL
jgi:hypothetical protein